MNDQEILQKINLLHKNKDKSLFSFVLEQINHQSNNIYFWLGLAITMTRPPLGDEETGILFCHKALLIDNSNPQALIILSYIYEHFLGGIDDIPLHQIRTLYADSDETNSMLKYVASWSYDKPRRKAPEIEELLLKESITLCNKYVWNYDHLARLYIKQKRYLEVNNVILQALSNVQKIYSVPDKDFQKTYDITNVNEFINARIKGIHLNQICYNIVKEKLIPTHRIIWYTITIPFLKFYHFIKEKILKFMNIEDDEI